MPSQASEPLKQGAEAVLVPLGREQSHTCLRVCNTQLDPTLFLIERLIGRRAAFVVYLFLLRHSHARARDSITVSLQTIASRTGLSKSCVPSSIRHLQRRGLLDPDVNATVTVSRRRIIQ